MAFDINTRHWKIFLLHLLISLYFAQLKCKVKLFALVLFIPSIRDPVFGRDPTDLSVLNANREIELKNVFYIFSASDK